MTKDLEDDLHRIISRAAEGAPQAPAGFPAQIVRRSRRRRARAHALAAALAVVVVAGGVGWAVRGQGGEGPVAVNPVPTASATVATGPAEPVEPVEPVERVWPQAVWRIPAKLPGVKKYQPRVFVDDHTVLLETWESFEKADAIYAYDLTTGGNRKIADIRTPKGVYASGYAVGQGRVVWQTIDDMRTTFWSVPVSGGEPAEIRTDAPVEGRVDSREVVGDRLAFSVMEGGVFTVPLTGGAVTPVAGAADDHLLRWPWAGTPGWYAPGEEPSFAELRNVETGETSKAVTRPGEQLIGCDVTTCVGRDAAGQPFYRLRDGSRQRPLPDQGVHGIAYDRFMTKWTLDGPERRQLLVDLATGRSGDLGLRLIEGKSSVSVRPERTGNTLVAYPLDGQYVIIDLTRIT